MAKKNVTIYTCDCCKKDFSVEDPKKESPLYKAYIPSKIYSYDYMGGYSKGISQVELCPKCYFEFQDYVQEKYEVDENYFVSMKKKGK